MPEKKNKSENTKALEIEEVDIVDEPKAFTPYTVVCAAHALNIRKGPGSQEEIIGCILEKSRTLIVDENEGWGKLEGEKGWINLSFAEKV